MGRKPQRRSFRRPSPQQRTEDANATKQRLDSAARALLASGTGEQVQVELQERAWQRTGADRAAQFDPNPVNLSRYRYARTRYDAAVAALETAGRAAE